MRRDTTQAIPPTRHWRRRSATLPGAGPNKEGNERRIEHEASGLRVFRSAAHRQLRKIWPRLPTTCAVRNKFIPLNDQGCSRLLFGAFPLCSEHGRSRSKPRFAPAVAVQHNSRSSIHEKRTLNPRRRGSSCACRISPAFVGSATEQVIKVGVPQRPAGAWQAAGSHHSSKKSTALPISVAPRARPPELCRFFLAKGRIP
jgi:hypothetical protein